MSVTVNQQFAWCENLLAEWGQDVLPWRREALRQTLVWQLQLAYLALLAELASSTQLALSGAPTSIQALIDRLPAGKGCPAEWRELQRLETSESWLASLRAEPSSPSALVARPQPAEGLIASSAPAQSLDQLAAALAALREFVERWRAQGMEY